MHPTALHWTSTLGESIWRMSGSRPPSLTIVSLFSAAREKGASQFELWGPRESEREREREGGRKEDGPLTARLPRAADAARWTSTSCELRRKRMGSSVSRDTSRTSFSVISAKASAAERCRSTLSEYERVERAPRGSPVKKLVSWRFSRYWRRSATASRSLSRRRGSYGADLVEPAGGGGLAVSGCAGGSRVEGRSGTDPCSSSNRHPWRGESSGETEGEEDEEEGRGRGGPIGAAQTREGRSRVGIRPWCDSQVAWVRAAGRVGRAREEERRGSRRRRVRPPRAHPRPRLDLGALFLTLPRRPEP